MFKNLMNFFRGEDFLLKSLDQFKTMLNNSEKMYGLVIKKLLKNEGAATLKDKIYELDKEINSTERSIRKKIVEHLNLQPSVDATACLLLMSVVKDAERLGDYCKNLYEVTEIMEGSISGEKFSRLLGNSDEEIANLFKETKKAFMESDEELARHAWEFKDTVSKQCEEAIATVAKSKDLSVNEAVCFALIARHFKRLTSHLINIATSVILPIDKLDYYDEKLK